MTTGPKYIVQNISALTDQSVNTLRILYTQWLLEHVTSTVNRHMTVRDNSTVKARVEIEHGCLFFLHGLNLPSHTDQTALCVPFKSQAVCPGLGIHETSESKSSGLGSLFKKYSSTWPGLGSHIYTLSGAKSWPWINSPLALNHFAPGPGSNIKS